MRMSSQQMYNSSLQHLQNTNTRIDKLNTMISTGKSILLPSDDPIGAVKVIGNQRDMAANNQYINNIDSLSNSFNRAETNLSSLVELQNKMREIAISTNNGSLSPQDRAAYGAEMETLLSTFTDRLNAQDESGNYLFSGNKTDIAPIVKNHQGEYEYQGDNKLREVQISSSSWVSANVTADALIFSNGSPDILNQTQAFIDTLNDASLSPGAEKFDNVVNAMQTSLNDTLTNTSRAITDIGGKQNSLSLVKSSHEQMVLFNKEVIGDIEGVDYAKAVTELNMQMSAYQITQKIISQVNNLSLFNQ